VAFVVGCDGQAVQKQKKVGSFQLERGSHEENVLKVHRGGSTRSVEEDLKSLFGM